MPSFFTDLPKNCEEALHWDPPYEKSGDVLVWPHSSVDPFLVYCDMDNIIKDRGKFLNSLCIFYISTPKNKSIYQTG